MKTLYAVKFSKWFVNGSLTGLMVDSVLTFATLDAAVDYVSFCHKHSDVPVDSIGGGDYTIHMARIETFSVSSENEAICLSVGRTKD